MFRNQLINLGLIKPDQLDIETAIIKKKLNVNDLKLIHELYSIKLDCKIDNSADSYVLMQLYSYDKSCHMRFFKYCKSDNAYQSQFYPDCQWIVEHLSNINSALDYAKEILSAKVELQRNNSKQIDEEQSQKQKCLIKLWELYK